MAASSSNDRMIAGVAAAAVALGVAQLVAIPLGARADARAAVSATIVDLTPGPIKEWGIQALGSLDKIFVSVAVVIAIVAIAALAGSFESTRRPLGSVAVGIAGLLGCLAVATRPGAAVVDVLPAAVGTVCAVVTLRLLVRRIDRAAAHTGDTAADEPDAGRRGLLAFGLIGFGVLATAAGTVVSRMVHSISAERNRVVLPRPRVPAAPIPAGVAPAGVALPNFVTAASDFYRIDTALSVPQLSRDDWRLRVHGMVEREHTYTFADLAGFEPVEQVITLTCVSNPVGGELVSTGVWLGYRLTDLLAAAGVHPDSDMLLSMSVDGFTAGTPVDALRTTGALLAIGLNGQALPAEHGYPARLVVPGLYGYVSATKWVIDLEFTRFDRAQAYWTRQGWAPRGPIKTESRIDVPRAGQTVAVGPVVFGGVAWAQGRGVRTVEVRIDDGSWQPAELGDGYSADTWRLWSFPWNAKTPGRHTITVRATDGDGVTQTAQRVGTVPDGATGWHTVDFTVDG